MLEKISAMNLKMAVVTSSHRTDAETLLSIFGIMKYFQFYVGQEDTVYQKPDPDPLILALKKLQLRSTDCIYVGDQPYDIIAAHGAGIKPLGAVWGSGRAERMDQYHPEAILENPEDVVEFIRRMKWTGKGKS